MVMPRREELLDWSRQIVDFTIALIITSIPVIVLSLVCMGGHDFVLAQATVINEFTVSGYKLFWTISATYWIIGLLYTIWFYLSIYLPAVPKPVKHEAYRGGGLCVGVIIGFLYLQHACVAINIL